MRTEKKSLQKEQGFIHNFRIKESNLKQESVPFSTYSVSLFSDVHRIYELALSSGMLSYLTYRNRILKLHFRNTLKTKPMLSLQGYERYFLFKSDSWFYKARRSLITYKDRIPSQFVNQNFKSKTLVETGRHFYNISSYNPKQLRDKLLFNLSILFAI